MLFGSAAPWIHSFNVNIEIKMVWKSHLCFKKMCRAMIIFPLLSSEFLDTETSIWGRRVYFYKYRSDTDFICWECKTRKKKWEQELLLLSWSACRSVWPLLALKVNCHVRISNSSSGKDLCKAANIFIIAVMGIIPPYGREKWHSLSLSSPPLNTLCPIWVISPVAHWLSVSSSQSSQCVC